MPTEVTPGASPAEPTTDSPSDSRISKLIMDLIDSPAVPDQAPKETPRPSTPATTAPKEEAPAPSAAPKPDPNPTPATPAATPTPGAKEEPYKPIKVTKRPPPQRPPVPGKETTIPPAAQSPASPAPASTPASKVSAPSDDDLRDNERDMIDQAKILEKKYPSIYKGHELKVRKFIRDNIEKVEKGEFVDNSPEHQQWINEHLPRAHQAHLDQIREERIEERVVGRSRNELEDLRHQIFVQKEEPRIEQLAVKDRVDVATVALPDELMAVFKSAGEGQAGLKKLQEDHPMEFDIARSIISTVCSDIKEFRRLNATNPSNGRRLADVAMGADDPRFEQHKRISDAIELIDNNFLQSGKGLRDEKDRWFATRAEYNSMPAAERSKWWTFSDDDLIKRMAAHSKLAINNVIKQQRDTIERYGYARAAKAAAAAAAIPAPVAPATPPRPQAPATPRPTPAPASDAPSPSDPIDYNLKNLAGSISGAR